MEQTGQQHTSRIGLYGGTFDPVHEGHLRLARHVLGRCHLDLLLFIPTLSPPHKKQPAASFSHRVAMLELALAGIPERKQMRVSLIEEQLPSPSYTINTVRALLAGQEEGARYFFITGADSVLDLHNWRQPQEILRLVNGIIVSRDRVSRAAIGAALQALDPAYQPDAHTGGWHRRKVLESSTFSVYQPDARTGGWCRPEDVSAIFLEDIAIPTSSSGIRAELACGRMPNSLPPAVATYIRRHQLYGASPIK